MDSNWSVGGNFTTLKNEVTKLYGDKQEIISGSRIIRKGETVNSFWMKNGQV